MWIAEVKYSKIAIPDRIEFKTKEQAEQYCKEKAASVNVRWTDVKEK